MKIIQLNCVYDSGSTGRIVKDIHRSLQEKGIDSLVLYGRGQTCNEANVQKVASEIPAKVRNVLSKFTGNLYGLGKAETKRTCAIIKKEQPDIVHLHCINGFFCDVYALLAWLKEQQIPTVMTLHAEFMYTGNCGYSFECNQWIEGCRNCPDVKAAIGSINKKAPAKNWQKMRKAFEGFDCLAVTGVSDWISQRARQSAILGNKDITTVLNGVDVSVFCGAYSPPETILQCKKSGKKVLLYVTPYFEDENKGGKWLLELAQRFRGEAVHFLVAGPTNREYEEPNITFLGNISNAAALAALYAHADLLVLTSKRETFSMVCAESLCCGTPIVGFRAGAPELIALPEYSEFVEYGNIDALEIAAKQWLVKEIDKKKLSQLACQQYSKQAMAEGYLAVYQKLLENADG